MERQNYKGLALITDLDGTLLTEDKTLSERDAAAIARFRAGGGVVSLATGRGLEATGRYVEMLKPDFPAVLYNGSMLYDTVKGQIAHKSCLPEGTREILEELMGAFPNLGAEILDENGVYVIQDSPVEREHLRITNLEVVLKDLRDIEPERCLKALFAGEAEEIAKISRYVESRDFGGKLSFTRSYHLFLELLPKDTTKGSALRILRGMMPKGTRFGATGDFDNDIAMLKEADYCGCPADAQPAVKAACLEKNGFVSDKTSSEGFFADWIAAFLKHFELTEGDLP